MSPAPAKPKSNKYVVLLLSGVILASGLFVISSLFSVNLVSRLQAAVASACANSDLWSDTTGFDPVKLTDFSRAGYMAGEEKIPNEPAQYNIKDDFNAKGDGTTDDTAAFQNAVATASGVVYIPEGEYLLSEPIHIKNNGVVLRGAGTDRTILKFKESFWDYCKYDYDRENKEPILKNVRYNEPTGTCREEIGLPEDDEGNKPFSHNRAFIEFGDAAKSQLKGTPRNINVLQAADRGGYELVIENANKFTEGQWIVLEMTDPLKPDTIRLFKRVLGGSPYGVNLNDTDDPISIASSTYRFINKITKITEGENGDTITLALPLTIDVRKVWEPMVSDLETLTSNVGIEDLRIVFPFEATGPHHFERGNNAIEFSSVTNCWASNVKINNSDNPIKLRKSAFCTIEDITLNDTIKYENDPEDPELKQLVRELKTELPAEQRNGVVRGEFAGHHGITLSNNSSHILVQDITFKNRFVHDITTTFAVSQNVFSRISGIDLRLDHHRHIPHNNLFTEIDTGLGTQVWKSTGGDGGDHGPQSGGYSTYWNITQKDGPVELPVNNNWTLERNPDQDFGLKLNFVFNTDKKSKKAAHESWVVHDRNRPLCTPNLYEAMKAYSDRTRGSEPTSIF